MEKVDRSIKCMNPSNLPHLAASCEGHSTAASLKHSNNPKVIIYLYRISHLGETRTEGEEGEMICCLQVYSGTSSLHLNILELSNPNSSLNGDAGNKYISKAVMSILFTKHNHK